MYHFFAYMARMKLIKRWGLQRSMLDENDQEHSLQVAMIAHALAVIRNVRYCGDLDEEKVALYAIYHDASEVITGDIPTPIKRYNQAVHKAYKQIEEESTNQLLGFLPADLRAHYQEILKPDENSAEWRLVKIADRICAYAKCVEEGSMGNREFDLAEVRIREEIDAINMPEVQDFMVEFLPSFRLSLDALNAEKSKSVEV